VATAHLLFCSTVSHSLSLLVAEKLLSLKSFKYVKRRTENKGKITQTSIVFKVLTAVPLTPIWARKGGVGEGIVGSENEGRFTALVLRDDPRICGCDSSDR